MASELQKTAKVALGGGKAAIEKQHAKGSSLPENVSITLDKNRETIEIGAFAGDQMYAEHGGCPSGGVVVLGYIKRLCVVVANDATVKAGMAHYREKNLRLKKSP